MHHLTSTTVYCTSEQYHTTVYPKLLFLGNQPEPSALNSFCSNHIGVHVFNDGKFTLALSDYPNENKVSFTEFEHIVGLKSIQIAKEILNQSNQQAEQDS
jgi:hypothetical protein